MNDPRIEIRSAVLATILLLPCSGPAQADYIATFEDLTLTAESYWNGSGGSGGYESGGVGFNNNYNATYGSWGGWAYSNMTDTTTPGYLNQYSAIAGGGADGSANYGVAFQDLFTPTIPRITLPEATLPGAPLECYVTNTTYSALSMLNGDAYSKKFGGVSGNDEDWFLLTITGKDAGGGVTGSQGFFLADFTYTDSGQDYILDSWREVVLHQLAPGTVQLEFQLTSSDVGSYGMNTPAFFAIDRISPAPEPGSLALCVIGGGAMSLLGVRARRRRACGGNRPAAKDDAAAAGEPKPTGV